MDLIVDYLDDNLLSEFVYPPNIAPDNIIREMITLTAVVTICSNILYFGMASILYQFMFDK